MALLVASPASCGDLLGARRRASRDEAERLLELVGMGGQADRAAAANSPMATSSGSNSPSRSPTTEAAADGRADRRHGAARAHRADAARPRASRASARIGVLFTEHDMDVVFGHADRVLVLNRGRLIAEGIAGRGARATPRSSAIYLGAGPVYDAGHRDERGLKLSVERPQRLLRPGAHPVRRRARGRRRRSGRRCSAATAPASRRPSAPSSAWSPQRSGRDRASTAATSRTGRPTRSPARGLGYVPEDRRIFTDLTVEENLEVGRQPPRPNAPHLDAGEAVRAVSQPRARCATAPAGA